MLVYKRSEESDIYDILVFVCQNSKNIKIPKTIKEIMPNAFSKCSYLTEIEIEKGSKIDYIHKDIFNGIKLERLTVPWCLRNIRNYIQNYENVTHIVITDEEEIVVDKFTFEGLPKLNYVTFSYVKDIKFQNGAPLLKFNVNYSSHLSIEDYRLKPYVRRVIDELLENEKFPTEAEEIKFLQSKYSH